MYSDTVLYIRVHRVRGGKWRAGSRLFFPGSSVRRPVRPIRRQVGPTTIAITITNHVTKLPLENIL